MKAGDAYSEREKRIILAGPHKRAVKLLPHRTPRAISATRYKLLNIETMRGGELSGQDYSAAEITLLRRFYPIMTTKAVREKYLPKRSYQSVQRKARNIGLRKKFVGDGKPIVSRHGDLVDQIRLRAKQDGITFTALDRELKCGWFWRRHWRDRRINLRIVVKAVEYFGGTLLIDWNDR